MFLRIYLNIFSLCHLNELLLPYIYNIIIKSFIFLDLFLGRKNVNSVLKDKFTTHVRLKYVLSASSLVNAIFVCVIISVFCGCFILLSHYQNVLSDKLYLHEKLIIRNESVSNYILSNGEQVVYNNKTQLDIFSDGIASFVEKKNWGFYDVIVCETVFKNDTVSNIMQVGHIQNTLNNLALYVTDYDKPLKLSGNTEILGDIEAPNGKTELAYINGQQGNAISLKGRQKKSKDRLPKIDKSIRIDISELPRLSLNNVEKGAFLINTFNTTTKVIDLSAASALEGIVCKGNYILWSDTNLVIKKSAKLNDVLLMAPNVRIESGFKGNVQIIATKNVIIEKEVSLTYPSSIYVKNDVQDSISVEIKSNSKLVGGIVINGGSFINSIERKLTIEKDALVIGDVYCYGSTQLKGSIIGRIYTDRFFLKTEASNYENTILNGSINSIMLPDGFVGLPLFNNQSNKKRYEVIKAF